jgi:hypothetical protein
MTSEKAAPASSGSPSRATPPRKAEFVKLAKLVTGALVSAALYPIEM